jgi:hypothetical protein
MKRMKRVRCSRNPQLIHNCYHILRQQPRVAQALDRNRSTHPVTISSFERL